MGQILDAATTFFTEDDWPFSPVDEKSALSLVFKGQNGQWSCYAQAREEHQQFVFYSVCPVHVPDDKQAALAEFLTRANYGLIVGNFEMDYNDGEIRFKTSIDVAGDRLSSALVKQCVYANVIMMDQYLPGIMSVMYSDAPPAQALAQIEG